MSSTDRPPRLYGYIVLLQERFQFGNTNNVEVENGSRQQYGRSSINSLQEVFHGASAAGRDNFSGYVLLYFL